jgi:hypothetical protein
MSILLRERVFLAQSLRKPITLNEYMPKELRRMENVFVACYHDDEEKTYITNVMKESHDNSLNLPHDVCNVKISFNDEDLLVGSKLHNHPLFIKDMSMKR